MLSALELRTPEGANGVHSRIRCICHILNLVVKVRSIRLLHSFCGSSWLFLKAILSQFTKAKKSDDNKEDELDDDEADRLDEEELEAINNTDIDREANYDEEIEGLEAQVNIGVTDKDLMLGKSALTKVWILILFFLYWSSTDHQACQAHIS